MKYRQVIYKFFSIVYLTALVLIAGCNQKDGKKTQIKFDSIENVCEKWLKSNCDSALRCSEVLGLFAKQSDVLKQKFRAARMKGKVYQIIGKHDSALYSFKKMMNFACQEKDTSDILDACSRIYLTFSSLQNNDSASFWLHKGKELSKITRDTAMLAIFESGLGQLYMDAGNKDSALRRFLDAQLFFESNNDTLNTAFSYRNIGNTLKQMEMLDDAIKYYKLALSLQKSLKNIVETAVELNNIAMIYKNYQPDSSRNYFILSMKMLDETGSIENQLMVRFNYANLLKSTKKYSEALEIYSDVYDKCLEANILRGQIISLNMMAKTYSIMNRNEEASVYFSKAINLANENKLSEDLKRLYNEAFSFYLEIGDVKNAKENFQKWEYLSDSLNSIAQMDNIIKYKTLYETEKKEKENKDLKNSIQIKARNNIIFISTGGILLVLLIFILYVYLQRTKYLKLLISRAQLKIEQYDNEAKTKAYAKVDNTKENEIAKAIHRILIDEKLYMNTQLTLEMLADEAKTNRKTLSQTINSSFGMNFNSLINFYRVEAAKKLLVDPLHKNHKMEAIGFIAGFNTRQNFYLAFNKYVGMSPAEYQQKNS